MRKNIIAGSIGLGLLALSGIANANSLTFNKMQDSSFEQWLTVTPSVTPSVTNKTIFQVSGLDAQFDSLSFSFVDVVGLTKVATVFGGVRSATSNDFLNNTYSLTSGTPYQVKISGITRAGLVGDEGTVSVNALNAVVTMVPEPESYAMLLAGLGLLGMIARRRARAGSKTGGK